MIKNSIIFIVRGPNIGVATREFNNFSQYIMQPRIPRRKIDMPRIDNFNLSHLSSSLNVQVVVVRLEAISPFHIQHCLLDILTILVSSNAFSS